MDEEGEIYTVLVVAVLHDELPQPSRVALAALHAPQLFSGVSSEHLSLPSSTQSGAPVQSIQCSCICVFRTPTLCMHKEPIYHDCSLLLGGLVDMSSLQ